MINQEQPVNWIEVSLEIGKKKIFASAVDWPGWSRGAPDEKAALQALLDYAPRYQRAIQKSGLKFQAPADISRFMVSERLTGNATTDFGTPGLPSKRDERPLDDAQLAQWQALLEACRQTFDSAAAAALGKDLRKGPRGGGRELSGIYRHVLEAETAYLERLGVKVKLDNAEDLETAFDRLRQAIRHALAQAAHGELPARGPRGGLHWTPRYFVRRAAWHALDHAWEIEDRSASPQY